jgi:hypothetical protein
MVKVVCGQGGEGKGGEGCVCVVKVMWGCVMVQTAYLESQSLLGSFSPPSLHPVPSQSHPAWSRRIPVSTVSSSSALLTSWHSRVCLHQPHHIPASSVVLVGIVIVPVSLGSSTTASSHSSILGFVHIGPVIVPASSSSSALASLCSGTRGLVHIASSLSRCPRACSCRPHHALVPSGSSSLAPLCSIFLGAVLGVSRAYSCPHHRPC